MLLLSGYNCFLWFESKIYRLVPLSDQPLYDQSTFIFLKRYPPFHFEKHTMPI